MPYRTHPSQYKDQPAITLESDQVTAQFLPGIGAKLCSLVYRAAGRELLVQRPNPAYLLAPYDGDYVAQGECSGLDDMFPSIDRCFYEGYPWRGTPIPDHGEVWSLPWEHRVEPDGSLYFGVNGVRFPYRLEKWVSLQRARHPDGPLPADQSFVASTLISCGPRTRCSIWRKGPSWCCRRGSSRWSPPSASSGDLGRYGDEWPWPCFSGPDGRGARPAPPAPQDVGAASKYFVKGRMPEGWCALTYPAERLHPGPGVSRGTSALPRRPAQRGRLARPLQHLPGAGHRHPLTAWTSRGCAANVPQCRPMPPTNGTSISAWPQASGAAVWPQTVQLCADTGIRQCRAQAPQRNLYDGAHLCLRLSLSNP